MKAPAFLRHLFRRGQAGGFTQEQYRTVLFRGEPGRPFAIVCPGGGFSYAGAIHEGFPLAIALSEMGYNAFSIQYRTGGAQVACEDLAQAIDLIMRHGFGLGIETTAEGWEKDAVRFWEKYISRKIELLTENIVKGRNRLRPTFAMLFNK